MGVSYAIVVEASYRREDNEWAILDTLSENEKIRGIRRYLRKHWPKTIIILSGHIFVYRKLKKIIR